MGATSASCRRAATKLPTVGPHDKMVRHYAAKTYTAREDAEGWLANERRSVEQGTWVAPALRRAEAKIKAETVADLHGTRWIAERKLRPRTRDGYESLLRLHIKPTALGRTPIADSDSAGGAGLVCGSGRTKHRTRNSHAYSPVARDQRHRRHRWHAGRQPVPHHRGDEHAHQACSRSSPPSHSWRRWPTPSTRRASRR